MSKGVNKRRSPMIEKTGTPRGEPLSIRDCVKLAAPQPKALKIIGEESERNGTSKLSSHRVDQIIKAARYRKTKR
jgi:hypothetical protein